MIRLASINCKETNNKQDSNPRKFPTLASPANKDKHFELLKSLTERYWKFNIQQRNHYKSKDKVHSSEAFSFPMSASTRKTALLSADQRIHADCHHPCILKGLCQDVHSKSADSLRAEATSTDNEHRRREKAITLHNYIELANGYYERGILKDINYLRSLNEARSVAQIEHLKEERANISAKRRDLHSFTYKRSTVFSKELKANTADILLEESCLPNNATINGNIKEVEEQGEGFEKQQIKSNVTEENEESTKDVDEDSNPSIVISVHVKPHGQATAEKSKLANGSTESRKLKKKTKNLNTNIRKC